ERPTNDHRPYRPYSRAPDRPYRGVGVSAESDWLGQARPLDTNATTGRGSPMIRTFRIEQETAQAGERGASWSEHHDLRFTKRFKGGEPIFAVYEDLATSNGTTFSMGREPF